MHLGVICLRFVLHSCETLGAGLFLWLEVLLNISFICKKMFCSLPAKLLVGSSPLWSLECLPLLYCIAAKVFWEF